MNNAIGYAKAYKKSLIKISLITLAWIIFIAVAANIAHAAAENHSAPFLPPIPAEPEDISYVDRQRLQAVNDKIDYLRNSYPISNRMLSELLTVQETVRQSINNIHLSPIEEMMIVQIATQAINMITSAHDLPEFTANSVTLLNRQIWLLVNMVDAAEAKLASLMWITGLTAFGLGISVITIFAILWGRCK